MSAYSLTHLSDREVLDHLTALVAADQQTTAALLAHLAEVDARALYLPAACVDARLLRAGVAPLRGRRLQADPRSAGCAAVPGDLPRRRRWTTAPDRGGLPGSAPHRRQRR